MKVFASSFHAWKSLERQSGHKQEHGLVFPLAVIEALGRPHGLEMTAEEKTELKPRDGFDAVFISVLDSRNLLHAAEFWKRWEMPFRWTDRPVGHWPLVWVGGQGVFNPLPIALAADLIVCGDAEDSLPALLALQAEHGNTARFLELAAEVAGVYVPRVHGTAAPPRIVRGAATDISVTLRVPVKVNTADMRRVEIARRCKFSCRFCSLGWNGPVVENTADDIVAAVRSGTESRVHLQAGDAESHSQIIEIRERLADKIDTGWTGRYDTTLDTRTKTRTHVEGWKRHAVGVEAMTWELRDLVGKGYLTDDRLVADTALYLSMIEPGAQGRLVWHMMAGLPGENRFVDILHFADVLRRIDRERTGQERRNLALHWQPFQPVPGTPMQWYGAGRGARAIAEALKPVVGLFSTMNCWSQPGRTDKYAGFCAVLARAGAAGGAALLEAFASEGSALSVADAERIGRQTSGRIDADGLPWDFVLDPKQVERLRQSRDAMDKKLAALN